MWKWKCSVCLAASEALLCLCRLFLRIDNWFNHCTARVIGWARYYADLARAQIGGEDE